MLKDLSCRLSERFFISPSSLNYNLAGQNILGCRFFPFSTLNISCYSLWSVKFLQRNQLIALWEFPCIGLSFSLAAIRILSLNFLILILICFGLDRVGFILFQDFCAPCTQISFLLQVWKVIGHNFLKYIMQIFTLSSPFGSLLYKCWHTLMLLQISLRHFSFFQFALLFAVLIG